MTTATLHSFVRDRILSDNAELHSFSAATGYASLTSRVTDPEDWASRPGIAAQMDAIERWARERGYSDVPTFTPPTRSTDLQIGDVIRLVGSVWGRAENDEVTVSEVTSEHAYANNGMWYLDGAGHWTWEFVSRPETATPEETAPERMEIPEGLEFTEYHPALLPLFTKAALAADAAGYCSEYDSIASEIGAPSRDEIKRLAGKRFTVKVPLTVNVEVTVTAYDEADAIREVRKDDFENHSTLGTWEGIENAIKRVLEDDPFQRRRKYSGHQAQYTDNWTVTPAE